MINPMQTITSILFTPGHRPERFAKAQSSGAHGIMLDLEDGVGLTDKAKARETICDYLEHNEHVESFLTAVRVNPVSTPLGQGDLARLSECQRMPQLLALPKVETPEEVKAAAELEVPLLIMIESELGLRRAAEIIAASERVEVLFFGGYDFAADLGAQCTWDAMLYIRSQLVLLARRFNCALWDVPYINLACDNDDQLIAECQQLKALGFTGRMAIHPKHIKAINEVFLPSAAEVADAKGIIEAIAAANGNACRYNGKMIDQPLVDSAERILAKYELRSH